MGISGTRADSLRRATPVQSADNKIINIPTGWMHWMDLDMNLDTDMDMDIDIDMKMEMEIDMDRDLEMDMDMDMLVYKYSSYGCL